MSFSLLAEAFHNGTIVIVFPKFFFFFFFNSFEDSFACRKAIPSNTAASNSFCLSPYWFLGFTMAGPEPSVDRGPRQSQSL